MGFYDEEKARERSLRYFGCTDIRLGWAPNRAKSLRLFGNRAFTPGETFTVELQKAIEEVAYPCLVEDREGYFLANEAYWEVAGKKGRS